ncbi:hypothetical protein MRX96_020236 [Rhipicephalus microplus]
MTSAALSVDPAVVGTVGLLPLEASISLLPLEACSLQTTEPVWDSSEWVDGNAADENLLSGLQSAVRVLSASREGRTVTVRFEGPISPDHVTLF